MIRNIIWQKELFVFNFWQLSEENISTLEINGQLFQSISIPSILGWKQQRIGLSALQWPLATNYSIIFWSSLMQWRLLVLWPLNKIAWHCPFNDKMVRVKRQQSERWPFLISVSENKQGASTKWGNNFWVTVNHILEKQDVELIKFKEWK